MTYNVFGGMLSLTQSINQSALLWSLFVSEFKFDGFSIDMTRSMVAMRDVSLLTYCVEEEDFAKTEVHYVGPHSFPDRINQ